MSMFMVLALLFTLFRVSSLLLALYWAICGQLHVLPLPVQPARGTLRPLLPTRLLYPGQPVPR